MILFIRIAAILKQKYIYLSYLGRGRFRLVFGTCFYVPRFLFCMMCQKLGGNILSQFKQRRKPTLTSFWDCCNQSTKNNILNCLIHQGCGFRRQRRFHFLTVLHCPYLFVSTTYSLMKAVTPRFYNLPHPTPPPPPPPFPDT